MAREGEREPRWVANPAAWVFLALFTLSWVVLALDRGQSLPRAPGLTSFVVADLFAFLVTGVLLFLARGRKPVDHRSGLPIRTSRGQVLGLLLYVAAVLLAGRLFGVGAHIASAGYSHGAATVWETQTPGSVLRWVLFNFAAGALLPLLYFLVWRREPPEALLLRFPRGKKWVVFCLAAGFFGILGADPASTFRQPLTAHLLTFLIMSLGTFLPVMILFESLLAPRLAILGRSAVTGAVLSGVAYGLYHPFEFFLDWSSGAKSIVSLAWLVQLMFFGVVKGIATLWTGSAWVHIFTTHTIHLSEAAGVARVFRLR